MSLAPEAVQLERDPERKHPEPAASRESSVADSSTPLLGGFPNNYLPILPDGMGGYFYVVCAEKNKPKPEGFGFVVHGVCDWQVSYEFCNGDFIDFVALRVDQELREYEN